VVMVFFAVLFNDRIDSARAEPTSPEPRTVTAETR
jgi:hypothetical protein